MSEKDPRNQKATGQPNANPPDGMAPKPRGSTTTARKGGAPSWSLVALLLIVAGGAVWYSRNETTSPPFASASPAVEEDDDFEAESEPVADALAGEPAAEAPEAEAAKPEAKPAPAPVAPATGTLEIRSGVSGADVFLNDKRVGTTPHKASGLAPGSYRVKVAKAGYAPFEQRVDLAAERRVVQADLVAALASLRVETNVPGATVSLDGEERGTAPLELSNLSPGRHQLEVSAEGYETRTETVELESGKRDIKIDLASPPPAASRGAVAVKHKHRIGSCEGVLRANEDEFEYDSPHKDAFSVALSEVERFGVEEETLSLKVRDGRNYNFKVSDGDRAALASFFERVAPSLEEKN